MTTGVWLAALKRPNVETVTDPIAEITPAGLRTKSGKTYDVDVIVLRYRLHRQQFPRADDVQGAKAGIDLHEQWNGDARAYLGVTVPNFPNLFILYGPNTNIVVNGSIIFFSECEVRYVQGLLEAADEIHGGAIEVKKDVHDAFNIEVDAANGRMAWGAPQVTSWYKNAKGRVSQNWPLAAGRLLSATRAPNPADYEVTGAADKVAAQ